MRPFLLLIGTIIGFLNIAAYSYLLLEAILNVDDIRESIKNGTNRLPILGIYNNYGTFLMLSFVMTNASALLVYGLIKRRTSFMWPWILTAFHVLTNYGYLMVFLLAEMLEKRPYIELASEFAAPLISFVGHVACYSVIFFIFKGLCIESLTRSYEITRW